MHELFEILNKRRHRRGSIDFDLKEPEIVLDDEGMVGDIIAAERNVAHQLIEEFMLLANETVAAHLDEHDVPTLYRVHEEPDPLKVDDLEEFIKTLGYSLGKDSSKVTPRDFRSSSSACAARPRKSRSRSSCCRTMQKARYYPSNLGHFGLAADSYTHFTSPIRRYPDLVVHRTLRESRHGGMTDERKEELTEDCRSRPPYLRTRAPRRRRGARAGAVEEGPVHGGQGRR